MVDMIWDRKAYSHCEHSPSDISREMFLAHASQEAITATRTYTVNSHGLLIADIVAKQLDTPVKGWFHEEFIIHKEGVAFVAVSHGSDRRASYGRSLDDDEKIDGQGIAIEKDLLVGRSVCSFTIVATGTRKVLEDIFANLETKIGDKKFAVIKWWHKSEHGVGNKAVYLPPLTSQLRPEFYPDMGDPRAFIEDYLSSDSSVLLVAGPPGTGKTTLLRHMILDHKLSAHVVYDEALMNSDSVFQSFLFERESNLLIIEDADVILTSREDSNNKLMARFLNVSDGLIKLPNKKLVFTTNISDFGRVDPALLRPGRCYATLHTRPLNLEEAKTAAKVAGLPIPVDRKEYTIAELFNSSSKSQGVRRIGFVK